MNSIRSKQKKLKDLNIFTSEQMQILQEYNISTPEQFIGICATSEGFQGILQALDVTSEVLYEILNQVKKHIPNRLAEVLSKPVEKVPSLGARKPKKKTVNR